MVVRANQEKFGRLRSKGGGPCSARALGPPSPRARRLALQRGPWHGSAALCAGAENAMAEVYPEAAAPMPSRSSRPSLNFRIFGGRPSDAAQQCAQIIPEVALTTRPGVDVEAALSIFKMRSLKDVTVDEQRAVIASMDPISFEPRAVVIQQGQSDPPRLIFFIEGGVEVLVTANGTTKSVRKLKAPFYVGEGRILDKLATQNNATVQCLDEPARGFVLSREACSMLIRKDSQVLKMIEREVKVRAFERRLQSGKGLFQELLHEPLFMSWMMTFCNRVVAAETILFTLAVTELKNLEELRKHYLNEELGQGAGADGATTDASAHGVANGRTTTERRNSEPASPTFHVKIRRLLDHAEACPKDLERTVEAIKKKCEEIWHTHIEVSEDQGTRTAHTLMVSISSGERTALEEARSKLVDGCDVSMYAKLFDVALSDSNRTIKQHIVPTFMQSEEWVTATAALELRARWCQRVISD